jgi:hypothetical protein
MHGVARRCSRLPWRPIVTGHPSPLISPTFYPPCSPGDPPAGQHRPMPSQKHWSLITTAKPLNCLAPPSIPYPSRALLPPPPPLTVRSRHRLGCSRRSGKFVRANLRASQPASSAAFISRVHRADTRRGSLTLRAFSGRSVRGLEFAVKNNYIRMEFTCRGECDSGRRPQG